MSYVVNTITTAAQLKCMQDNNQTHLELASHVPDACKAHSGRVCESRILALNASVHKLNATKGQVKGCRECPWEIDK